MKFDKEELNMLSYILYKFKNKLDTTPYQERKRLCEGWINPLYVQNKVKELYKRFELENEH